MTTTASAKRSRGKGARAELALAGYLRDHGWPHAVRAIRTGTTTHADPGDITGIPGLIISCKDWADPGKIPWPTWWRDLDAMLTTDPIALGIIVEKRPRQSDVGLWWAHLRLGDLVGLAAQDDGGPSSSQAPVRLPLGDLVRLLRDAGYTHPAATA